MKKKPAKKPVRNKVVLKKKKQEKKNAAEKKKPKYVNLRDAAIHCGVGHNTFRNYIGRYPTLPIHRHGVGREGYQIDLEKLDKWREENNLLNWTPRTLSVRTGEGDNGISDEKRKSKLEADLLQLKYDREMERVVDKHEVAKFLSTRISQLAKRLDAMPALIGRKCGLPPDIIEKIRRYTDDSRVAMLNDDEGYFAAI